MNQIVNTFDNLFVNVGPYSASTFPQCDSNKFEESWVKRNSDTIFLSGISEADVIDIQILYIYTGSQRRTTKKNNKGR